MPPAFHLQKQAHGWPSHVLNPKYFTYYGAKRGELTLSLFTACILMQGLPKGV